ncbi:MAG: adenylate/guanylate cyclase domain-containing protein [Nitriliruptorales bacterium]|nr:adenylate/guanylate cyclase domain-containing protein [Nitriliruptorales bacterium]
MSSEVEQTLERIARALGGDQTFSRKEVSDEVGVPLAVLQARDEALGVQPLEHYTETELEDARALKALLDAVGSDALVRTSREDAALVRRLAITHLQVVRDEILHPLLEEYGDDLDAVADSLADLADPLFDRATKLLATTYRRVLIDLLASEVVALGMGGDETLELAVGFADVVGYTSLTARVDPSGLKGILQEFEDRCHRVAVDRDVQLVKFLGDAALYVSSDPTVLADVLLDLVDPIDSEQDGDPRETGLSAGLGFGEVVLRSGDVYGAPVNMAARLTDLAVGGSLVADDELRDALEDGYRLSTLPPTKLHGIGRRRPLRVRRGGADD